MALSREWWCLPPLLVAPSVKNVTRNSVFWRPKFPQLGLNLDRRYAYRVYVLECASRGQGEGSTWYVGISSAEGLPKRLQEHFALNVNASHFTNTHRPNAVAGIWTVMSQAAEAYVPNLALCFVFSSLKIGQRVGGTFDLSGAAPLLQPRAGDEHLMFNIVSTMFFMLYVLGWVPKEPQMVESVAGRRHVLTFPICQH